MKTKQLFVPILLMLLSACKKDIAPSESANDTLQGKTNLKGQSFASNTTSDQYKISSITSTYPSAGVILSHLEQATYTYGADGKLSSIAVATTERTKRPKIPITSPVVFDTVTVTSNVNHNYTYRANTVTITYEPSFGAGYWRNTFVFDSQGRVVMDTIRIFNTTPGSAYTDPRVYNYTTVNSVAKTISVTEPGFITQYNLTNDNLSSQLSDVSAPPQQQDAFYSFYTDKASQPADALSLNQQLSPYGYASISSINLSQSASPSTNPNYSVLFGTAYGIDSIYNSYADVKFAYEFDSAGRVSKITETGRASNTTTYNILRIRVITYVNN